MGKKFKLFCFGFGQVAQNFVKKLIKQNYQFDLVVTTTSKSSLNKKILDKSFKSLLFNGNDYDINILKELSNSSNVLISIPPISGEDIVFKNFGDDFNKSKFDWITYLSSTSVYGNKDGAWVDENSKTLPTTNRGKHRLNSENLWLKLYTQHKIPVIIFRLAGIYSLKNNVINRLKNNTVKIVDKKNHFFSRIYVEDISQALINSMQLNSFGDVFNICDDLPCSNEELKTYAAKLIRTPVPLKIKFENLEDEITKSFYRDSKRVKNNKMKNTLKVKLKYPTYKEGLSYIISHLS